MRMITPGMARALTPTEFVEREKAAPRHRRERDHLVAARAALSRLAHTLRHPRLRHVGYGPLKPSA
ncbi:MAG: hypothetical protein ABR500_16485 [Dermatophilaceae bacterium]|nr:hypothetical protein [Intrasporangiaceae bacterium]